MCGASLSESRLPDARGRFDSNNGRGGEDGERRGVVERNGERDAGGEVSSWEMKEESITIAGPFVCRVN